MADPLDLLEDLDSSLASLTTALAPLLSTPLSELAATLTVADKARLHVLATYTLDSLLFSYLRLQGANIKNHAIMGELARVRQYVAKIKAAQSPAAVAQERPMALDRSAAERFIKAGLAGNDKHDADRAEQARAQKEAAAEKLRALDRKQHGPTQEGEDGDDTAEGGGGSDKKKEKKAKRTKAEKEARKEQRRAKRQKRRELTKDEAAVEGTG